MSGQLEFASGGGVLVLINPTENAAEVRARIPSTVLKVWRHGLAHANSLSYLVHA